MKFSLTLYLAVLFVLIPVLGAEEYRTLTNREGQSIRAVILVVTETQVSVRLQNGSEFTLFLTQLSDADQASLRQWRAASFTSTAGSMSDKGVEAGRLNAVIGHELFAQAPLWQSSPEETASRLSWARESRTALSESYRIYPRPDYRFFGARPYSGVLYGEEGRITSVSLVYANKGDSFSSGGRGEEHFIKGKPVPGGMDGVQALMSHDAEVISGALIDLLGPSTKQRFGEGESRVNVERWDWNGHAFLLSHVEGEYVSLAIEQTAFADARGRSARVPDSVIRERVRNYVERRENGDVVISNIPMVDQGPKGYCVPATAERCMRFLGIPADMYLLAMAGETQAGGGTSVGRLLENIGSDIKRKGRSFEVKTGELKMREIQRTIDSGIPLIWTLFSTKEFNQRADSRRAIRQAGGWDDYKAILAGNELSPLVPEQETSHVVIIMGYNEETNEIAFSDSWGEGYQERWITLPEAEQVSQQRFYMIGL